MISLRKAPYASLIFVNSGVLWNLPGEAEIPFLQEAYLFILCLYFALHRLPKIIYKGVVDKFEISVLFFILVLLLWPSITANVIWGQPLYYGMIEERRALGYFILFPLLYGLRQGVFSVEELMKWITVTSMFCFILAAYYYITELYQPIYNIDELRIRGDRIGVGVQYILLSYFYALHKYLSNNSSRLWIVVLLVALIDLFAFIQTRTLIIGMALPTLWIVARRLNNLVKVFFAIFLGIAVLISINPQYVIYILEKYIFLFSSPLSSDAFDVIRVKTIKQSMDLVVDTAGMGGGSLSHLWMDGYHRIFGVNYFLSDIGYFGSLVRFGIFAIIIHAVFWMTLFRLATNFKYTCIEVKAAKSYLVMALLISSLNPMMEFGGYMIGMLIAILVINRQYTPNIFNTQRG